MVRSWPPARATRRSTALPATPVAALARAGLIELGYAPGEADGLLLDAEGDSAEELLAHALRVARSGS